MKTSTIVAGLAALALLAGCGRVAESRLNPFNWFGRSAEAPATLDVAGAVVATDPRQPVDQVIDMRVRPASGGAIVQATGLPPTQGFWMADLVAENEGKPDDKGVLTYRFLVAPPPTPMPSSTQRSREVSAGVFISTQKLEGVRQIVVTGARNSRVAGR